MKRSIAIVFVCAALVQVSVAGAQTLAEIARQEAARRQGVTTPGKVFTNTDLKSAPAPATPAASAPAAGTTLTPPPTLDKALGSTAAEPAKAGATSEGQAPGAGAPGGEKKDEAYWRGRVSATRDALARARTFQDALQARIGALQLDFVNRDNPVQRTQVERDLTGARAEMERVKKEIADGEKGLTAIADEARRAGVPAGWVR